MGPRPGGNMTPIPGFSKGAASVAKCHTFYVFGNSRVFLGIQATDFKGEKKVSHLSHLSPLSHFGVLLLNCN